MDGANNPSFPSLLALQRLSLAVIAMVDGSDMPSARYGVSVSPPVTGTSMKSPADFLVFTVRQAREAEAFGFTRNACCRNLKTALHHHWQHKTMGLHGQAMKPKIPRSRAAQGRPLSECIVEHAVPQMAIVNWLMELDPLTNESVEALLKRYFTVMLVTEEEHARLNASGLRSTMPPDWDGENVFARYDAVGIEYA
jgi:hypothetical protein